MLRLLPHSDCQALWLCAPEWVQTWWKRHQALSKVRTDGFALEDVDPELQGDREIVMEAVATRGLALQYAAAELRSDREVVMTAVKRTGYALLYAADHLKNDREIVLIAVAHRLERSALADIIGDDLKADRDFILTAVAADGLVLEFAAEELKRDQEIVLTAVENCGSALLYAAEDLKTDRAFILTAVRQHGHALRYAAETFLQDESFAVQAREELYLFKIMTMSGRSCIVAWRWLHDTDRLLDESCAKLGMRRTGAEKLVYGVDVIPDGLLGSDTPGIPSHGKLIEYQLVRCT
mmetsp:Transcript_38626/g.70269  ORF Transcript_38626/g.70269 Transcript_38626/m.70269 type:complete len:294 (-) Transcript_38626:126-1007(-)